MPEKPHAEIPLQKELAKDLEPVSFINKAAQILDKEGYETGPRPCGECHPWKEK